MTASQDRPEIFETIHHDDWNPAIFSPYVPAIKVARGTLVFMSGMLAAPVYHDHPHRPEVFDAIPQDIEGQTQILFDNLDLTLKAAGCQREHIVQLMRFFTDVAADQDFVNQFQAEWFRGHIPTSTSVEVKRLATDPRLRLEIQAIAVAP